MVEGQAVRREPPFAGVVNLRAIVGEQTLPSVPDDKAVVGERSGIGVHAGTQPHETAAAQIHRAVGRNGQAAVNVSRDPFQRHQPGEGTLAVDVQVVARPLEETVQRRLTGESGIAVLELHAAGPGDLSARAPFGANTAGELEQARVRRDRALVDEVETFHRRRARAGGFDQRAGVAEGRAAAAATIIMREAIRREFPAAEVVDLRIVIGVKPLAAQPGDGAGIGEHRRVRAVARSQSHVGAAAQPRAPALRNGHASVEPSARPVEQAAHFEQARAGERMAITTGQREFAARPHETVRAEGQADAGIQGEPLRHRTGVRAEREAGDAGGHIERDGEVGRAGDGDVIVRERNTGRRPVVVVAPQGVSARPRPGNGWCRRFRCLRDASRPIRQQTRRDRFPGHS